MPQIRRLALAATTGLLAWCIPHTAQAAVATPPTFTAPISTATTVTTGEISVFDVDGDGMDDVVHLTPTGVVTVQIARSRGRFRAPTTVPTGLAVGTTRHLHVFRETSDGPVSFVYAEAAAPGASIHWYRRSDYDPIAETATTSSVGFLDAIDHMHVGRFGPGGAYAIASVKSGALMVLSADLENLGTPPARHYPANASGGPIGSFDLDADGDLDLVAGNNPTHFFAQYRNDGNGIFTPVALGQPGTSEGTLPAGPVSDFAALDIGDDGIPDLLVTNRVPGSMSYVRGVRGAPGGQVPHPRYWASGTDSQTPTPLLVGDYDGNGSDDLAWNFAENGLAFFLQGTDIEFLRDFQSDLELSGLQHDAATGDVNGDGRSDIVTIGADRGIDLYLSSGGDVTAPTITLDSAPPSRTNETTAAFEIGSTEPNLIFECQVDGGEWVDCSAAPSVPGLTEGSHTGSIRAIDAAGNRSEVLTHTWTIDTTAPTTTIASGPSPFSDASSATFNLTSDDEDATFECRHAVDGEPGSWSACPATHVIDDLAEGVHELQVRAKDVAGNVDPSPATHDWTIDRTPPPVPTLTAGPVGVTSAPLFVFSSSEDATFMCQVDDEPWVACASPFAPDTGEDGPHTVRIRAHDPAGNASDAVERGFVLDTVAPDAPVFSEDPDDATNAPRFSFGGATDSTFECRIDNGSWAPCTSPFEPTGLADGPHRIDVRQLDPAGNRSDALGHSFVLDATAPGVPTLTAAPEGPTSAPAFAFDGEDDARFECRIDDAEWAACSSPHVPTGLDDGEHRFALRQIDAVGNVSDPLVREFVVDTDVPAAPAVLGGPTGTVTTTDATFSFAGEPGSTFQCSLDGGPLAPCASPLTLSGLSVGPHHLRIVQSDAAGNVGAPIDQRWEVVAPPVPTPTENVPVPTPPIQNAPAPAPPSTDSGRVRPASTRSVPSKGMFPTGSARMTTAGRRYLRSVARDLGAAKAVTCVGHTDARGSRARNRRLGQQRAAAVCRTLRRLGVTATVRATSKGESQPRATNATARGRALNRRVVLRIRYR